VGSALISAKQPRVVVQVDVLPRTDATGQIRRRKVRDQIVAERAVSPQAASASRSSDSQ
jgi:acyl-coenzyme A synthetase/AMP-(fatty) acid ligase